jgi:hypothetical protein
MYPNASQLRTHVTLLKGIAIYDTLVFGSILTFSLAYLREMTYSPQRISYEFTHFLSILFFISIAASILSSFLYFWRMVSEMQIYDKQSRNFCTVWFWLIVLLPALVLVPGLWLFSAVAFKGAAALNVLSKKIYTGAVNNHFRTAGIALLVIASILFFLGILTYAYKRRLSPKPFLFVLALFSGAYGGLFLWGASSIPFTISPNEGKNILYAIFWGSLITTMVVSFLSICMMAFSIITCLICIDWYGNLPNCIECLLTRQPAVSMVVLFFLSSLTFASVIAYYYDITLCLSIGVVSIGSFMLMRDLAYGYRLYTKKIPFSLPKIRARDPKLHAIVPVLTAAGLTHMILAAHSYHKHCIMAGKQVFRKSDFNLLMAGVALFTLGAMIKFFQIEPNHSVANMRKFLNPR